MLRMMYDSLVCPQLQVLKSIQKTATKKKMLTSLVNSDLKKYLYLFFFPFGGLPHSLDSYPVTSRMVSNPNGTFSATMRAVR